MIKRGEMLNDVQPQDVTVAASKCLKLIDGSMGTFADAVGVAMRIEAGFKQRFDDVTQCVVDDPVAERRSADAPPLRFVDGEVTIIARPIRFVFQFGL